MSPYFIIKTLMSALLIASISEVAKRNTFWGALIASLPFVSLLSLVWTYLETRDIQRVIDLSYGIFWLVIPSLAFFLCLPVLLKWGIRFWASILISSLLTMLLYFILGFLLRRLGVSL